MKKGRNFPYATRPSSSSPSPSPSPVQVQYDDDNEEDVEYSFALEYDGPPIPYNIPRAIPVAIDRIPIASVVEVPLSDSISIPVVQPLQFFHNLPHKESPTSVLVFADGDGVEDIGIKGDNILEERVQEFRFSHEIESPSSARRKSVDSPGSSDPKIGSPSHAKKHKQVYFEDVDEDTGSSPERESSFRKVTRGESKQKTKKGSCHGCGRGNIFTEKEACLVCNAKFCMKCVFEAMGSMPEGRKCLTCIGQPVMECNMQRLGKCSRMLRKVLNSQEIQQLMNSEKQCEANQTRPEHVLVNGKPLSRAEMITLMNCSVPPSKLVPGFYWYDKVSGLWGKEGHRPLKIITSHLDIGGHLSRKASNGNTGICINNREITKPELTLLQFAGVQCAGNPNFWVDNDGSYREEGQKSIKGNLWSKTGTKLLCSFLSLPIPPKLTTNSGGELTNVDNRKLPDYIEHQSLTKLLLLGSHESGASTIFKKVRFLYNPIPFTEEERKSMKLIIQRNIYNYLAILLEYRNSFEDECLTERRHLSLQKQTELENRTHVPNYQNLYSLSPKLKGFSDFLLQAIKCGSFDAIFPASTREYAPLVAELWESLAIQETYKRKSEILSLPSVASHFLGRVAEISRPEYEPLDIDIMYLDDITSSNFTEFSFPPLPYGDAKSDTHHLYEASSRYQLIQVNTKGRGENCKWLEMFEGVRMVIFCVALTDYNEYGGDESGVTINKMLAAKKLFECIVAHPTLREMDFLLVLNKFDVFEETVEQAPLTLCDWFNDFNPLRSRHSSNNNNARNRTSYAHQAFYYIAIKFKRLFASLTDKKLYVTKTNGLDAVSIDEALRYAREIIVWEDERAAFESFEDTIYSTDPGSLMH